MAAVGTLVVTTADLGGSLTKYTLAWTSNASGAVSGNPFSVKRQQHTCRIKPGGVA